MDSIGLVHDLSNNILFLVNTLVLEVLLWSAHRLGRLQCFVCWFIILFVPMVSLSAIWLEFLRKNYMFYIQHDPT